MPFSKEQIKELLDRNDVAVWRGVVSIYQLQTEDEQQGEQTRWQNGMGFSSYDSKLMSSFAKQIIAWQETDPDQRKFKSPLSPKQLPLARRIIKRYAGQLAKIANSREQQEQEQREPGNVQASLDLLAGAANG